MNTSDCFYLGHVSKPFGFKGEIIAYFDVDDPGRYQNMESVFLLIEGKLIPFFIQNIRFKPHSREAVIRLQDVNSEEKAQHLCGSEMYLPLTELPSLKGNAFYFHEVENFLVVDKRKGSIGSIVQVLDLPGNPIFQIQQGDKEIMVPARDEFIEKVDRDKRTIYIQAPDGLIDLYLDDREDMDTDG
jgi:16S rRNA processing protein RimM